MFGLSFTHLVLLAIIVLVFIGPEQLPEVARTFARLLNEWKRATSDIQSSLTNSLKNALGGRMSRPPPPQEQPPTAPQVQASEGEFVKPEPPPWKKDPSDPENKS